MLNAAAVAAGDLTGPQQQRRRSMSGKSLGFEAHAPEREECFISLLFFRFFFSTRFLNFLAISSVSWNFLASASALMGNPKPFVSLSLVLSARISSSCFFDVRSGRPLATRRTKRRFKILECLIFSAISRLRFPPLWRHRFCRNRRDADID